jgi:hypothetical protein
VYTFVYIYICNTTTISTIIIGRYPLTIGRQLGVLSAVANNSLSSEEITLAEVLKSGGDMNYIVGKWHLGAATPCDLPTARGFDYFTGFTLGIYVYICCICIYIYICMYIYIHLYTCIHTYIHTNIHVQ